MRRPRDVQAPREGQRVPAAPIVVSADIVTYATLADMLTDTNRTGAYTPNANFGVNIVGSGASIMPAAPVPEPGILALMAVGLAGLRATRRRRTR